MPSATDIIKQNIQKQVALNSGQLSIVSAQGSFQYVNNSNGQPLPSSNDAGNFQLSNAPAVYQTSMQAQVYDYAKGLFGGRDVPNELVEVLATMATYYSVQTGQPVSSLFNKGVLLNDFMATVNTLRNNTSQIGYAGLNLTPNWSNNPVLRASVAKAISPYDATGLFKERSQYDKTAAGFTFFATDTNTVWVRETDIVGTWVIYVATETAWPS